MLCGEISRKSTLRLLWTKVFSSVLWAIFSKLYLQIRKRSHKRARIISNLEYYTSDFQPGDHADHRQWVWKSVLTDSTCIHLVYLDGIIYMHHVMRKHAFCLGSNIHIVGPRFCICENKGVDQLHGNRADQRLFSLHR